MPVQATPGLDECVRVRVNEYVRTRVHVNVDMRVRGWGAAAT